MVGEFHLLFLFLDVRELLKIHWVFFLPFMKQVRVFDCHEFPLGFRCNWHVF